MIWPHLPLQTKGLLLSFTTPSTIPYPSYSCTDLKLCSLPPWDFVPAVSPA